MQPWKFPKALQKVDQEAQRKQWKSSLAKFTRLLWSMDWEGSLRTLISQPASISVFGRWLQGESPENAMQLELLVLTAELQKQPAAQQPLRARRFAEALEQT